MTVVNVRTAGAEFSVSGEGYRPKGNFLSLGVTVQPEDEKDLELLLKAAVLCNDAQLIRIPGSDDWSMIGDPTEGALLVAAAKGSILQKDMDESFPRIQEIPFDSDRKMMTTFHNVNEKTVAFCKGAPDIILSHSAYIVINGVVRPMNEDMLVSVRRNNKEMASRALRVLAVAFREFDGMPSETTPEQIEVNLIFIGLIGMIDPLRHEAKAAVQICKEAGIRPIMITGDHPDTALAIAREVGITDAKKQVVEGWRIDAMPEEELRQVVQWVNVFARVSPANKMAIVNALKYHGVVTAVTGDGVNDAPAMRRADIGVAMGIAGTEVTKETADMVIVDDNFASIVTAIEEGRVIYANIRKAIYFLLSCNSAEILVIGFAILAGWPMPLQPIQLLWVNLVTDALPALALGMETKEPDIMKQKPRSPGQPLLNWSMMGMLAVQSIIMALTILGAFQYVLYISGGDLVLAQTVAFISLISTQLLCAYSSRSEIYSVFQMGFFSNRYLNVGIGFSCLILFFSVQDPVNEFFKTTALSGREWFMLTCLTPIPFLTTEIYKTFRRVFSAVNIKRF